MVGRKGFPKGKAEPIIVEPVTNAYFAVNCPSGCGYGIPRGMIFSQRWRCFLFSDEMAQLRYFVRTQSSYPDDIAFGYMVHFFLRNFSAAPTIAPEIEKPPKNKPPPRRLMAGSYNWQVWRSEADVYIRNFFKALDPSWKLNIEGCYDHPKDWGRCRHDITSAEADTLIEYLRTKCSAKS